MASSEAAAAMKIPANNNPLMVVNQQQQQQQHPAPLMEAAPPPAKKKRNLPGTPGKRGHNLPWKLRQRSGKELPRKRVYICPEKTCVHHNPARALGDLTGIKKHFCRKHGEKKWKCEKCSKRYAVQSDWKAHSKTCGTREYRCECGTLFSRRDSFITHRAFCDALAQETARHQLTNNHHHQIMQQHYYLHNTTTSSSVFAAADEPPPPIMAAWHHQSADDQQHHQLGLGRMVPSLFSSDAHQHANTKQPADMSATALLQKAAQIGAVTSSSMATIMGGGAFFCGGFDIDDDKQHHQSPGAGLVFGGTQLQQQQNNVVPAASSFDDVLSAVRHHATGLNNLLKDAAVAREEETRDLLGVGVQQALCSSSLSLPLHGWI
ncbi:hypothetical protein PR202_ga24334 [Eleusine coracana subsp. coracana]|uniref:C2H2-type domain-containing protein n=1 Tax=Eleusine coracana subsp. coracana TaxID=191504 RepID=A0AAV5D849_ELECO|nr:hypothetical protein PR202_ga24334 [Eleusine coracana subsp. coracana]